MSRFDHHDPCRCGHAKTDHRGKFHQGACEVCWPPTACHRYKRVEWNRVGGNNTMPAAAVSPDTRSRENG